MKISWEEAPWLCQHYLRVFWERKDDQDKHIISLECGNRIWFTNGKLGHHDCYKNWIAAYIQIILIVNQLSHNACDSSSLKKNKQTNPNCLIFYEWEDPPPPNRILAFLLNTLHRLLPQHTFSVLFLTCPYTQLLWYFGGVFLLNIFPLGCHIHLNVLNRFLCELHAAKGSKG